MALIDDCVPAYTLSFFFFFFGLFLLGFFFFSWHVGKIDAVAKVIRLVANQFICLTNNNVTVTKFARNEII